MRVWYKDKQAELRLVDKGVAGFEGIPDNSIDSIVTDPPYHLYSIVKRFGKEDAAPAKFGTDGVFQRASKGFMGKEWDGGDVSYAPATWAECLRMLKPGGHMLCFGGSRTFHRIAVAIEDAGFELRDTVMWVYGSGFPKSHNLQGEWQGWGTALKPAFEPIILARKPVEGTVAGNVLKWGTGAINVDGCRVSTGDDLAKNYTSIRKSDDVMGERIYKAGFRQGKDSVAHATESTALGRWPANFIHDGSEEVLELMPDVGGGQYKGANPRPRNNGIGLGSLETRVGSSNAPDSYGDSGSAARFFMKCEWDGGLDTDSAARFNYCAKASKRDRDEGCEGVITWEGVDLSQEMLELRELLKDISADMMQELANVEWSTIWSGKKLPYATSLKDMLFITSTGLKMTTDLKTLSACPSLSTNDFTRAVLEMSRVNGLSLATTADSIDLLKQATTSDQMALALDAVVAVLMLLWRIKEKGRQGNGHATVKPTSLMRYLCRLITPPNGLILDPFMGSGSTGKAAVLEGFRFMGLDITEEYMPIAEARIKWAEANAGMEVEGEGEDAEDGADLTLF